MLTRNLHIDRVRHLAIEVDDGHDSANSNTGEDECREDRPTDFKRSLAVDLGGEFLGIGAFALAISPGDEENRSEHKDKDDPGNCGHGDDQLLNALGRRTLRIE